MALALDGHASSGLVGSATATAVLTTTSSNDIIIAAMLVNDSGGNGFSGVASTNTTGWTLRAHAYRASSVDVEEVWVGKAAAPLSSESITATAAAGTPAKTLHVFAISGADQTSIFDSNGGLPVIETAVTTQFNISTSNANDFIFAVYRIGIGSPTAGAGWTTIEGDGFLLTEYQIVSAPQTSLAATVGTGSGNEAGGIGHAIIQSAPASALPPYIQNWF